jgi:multidrug efflux pump
VTAFGLFLTPIFYVLLRTLESKFTRKHEPTAEAYVAHPHPAAIEAPHNYEG